MKRLLHLIVYYLLSVLIGYTFFSINTQTNKSHESVSFTPTQNVPTLKPTPSVTPTPSPEPTTILIDTLPRKMQHSLPFTSQAPSAQWENPIFQDACEEASLIMVSAWLNGVTALSPVEVEAEIQKLVDFERKFIGTAIDASAKDTAKILANYFKHEIFDVVTNPESGDIIHAIARGSLVVAPTNGQMLKNPNFTSPGPERHMVVIIGYDLETKQFITHDPGTRSGSNYRYSMEVLMSAIADYPTGNHAPADSREKRVIIVQKSGT